MNFMYDSPNTLVGRFSLAIGQPSIDARMRHRLENQEISDEQWEQIEAILDTHFSGNVDHEQLSGRNLRVIQLEADETTIQEIVETLLEDFQEIGVWLNLDLQFLVPCRFTNREILPGVEVPT